MGSNPFFLTSHTARAIYRVLTRAMLLRAAAAAASVICVFGAHTTVAQEAPLKIRMLTMSEPGSPVSLSIEHFKDRAEAEGRGMLQIEILYSSKNYDGSQAIAAISSGAVEMGAVELVSYTDKIPAADALQLPFLFNSEGLGTSAGARNSPIRAVIDKEIAAKTGERVLWWIPLGRTVSLSKGFPVADHTAIAGKNVFAAGPASERAVKLCGGSPVKAAAQSADIHTAGIVAVVDRQLWRTADTLTRTNLGSMQVVVSINAKLWQSMSEEKRLIIAAAARLADEEARGVLVHIETTAYKMLADEHGIKVVDLTPEQLMQWRVCSSDVLYDFTERSGPAGQQLMVAYGRMRASGAQVARMESKDFRRGRAGSQSAPAPEIGLIRARPAAATH
jgi:TRAP-type C4-dicarboxylate transport system substrate-binding protein